MAGRASAVGIPSKEPELHCTPSASKAASRASPSGTGPSAGRITGITGMAYLRANSKSRWSWAGTPMMAPVP